MNNRGKPLTTLEKLKNRLLYMASKFDATTVDIKDGYVTLITDDPIFESNFSDEYKSKLIDEYMKIKNGILAFVIGGAFIA